jgi:hypothetical protein
MKIGICLTCQGDTVKFVQNNFLFDIQAHLQNKAQASISDILKEPRIDAGPLVRDYLRHMGYSETIACLTIKDTTDVYIHRKNTIDAAAKGKLETLEQLEEKTESAESEAVISET